MIKNDKISSEYIGVVSMVEKLRKNRLRWLKCVLRKGREKKKISFKNLI